MMWHLRGLPGDPGGLGSRETRLEPDSRSGRSCCPLSVRLPIFFNFPKFGLCSGGFASKQQESGATAGACRCADYRCFA